MQNQRKHVYFTLGQSEPSAACFEITVSSI